MRCNVIGAGRLGKSLIFALKKFKIIHSICVYSKNKTSDLTIQKSLQPVKIVSELTQLPPADLTFITTPDEALLSIVDTLANKKILLENSMIIHCSGALSSKILNPLKESGCHLASFHPAKAFHEPCLQKNAFKDVYCLLEGDKTAVNWLEAAFKTMGARIISILPENKALYHTACVIASNYLVTLSACARELMKNSNIPKKEAKAIIQQLMLGTLTNLDKAEEANEALTGPLIRGDMQTLALHLHSLKSFPAYDALYRAAGLASLHLTNLSSEEKTHIQETFDLATF